MKIEDFRKELIERRKYASKDVVVFIDSLLLKFGENK